MDGAQVKDNEVLGDGVMAVFTSARSAIDAAQRCRDLGNEAGLPLHIGIHAGDVVREGNNVHGGALAFWRQVIGEYTGGRYEERFEESDLWHGPVQTFDTQQRA